MAATHDVTGVGAAIVDILARVDEPTIDRLDLPKGAMSLVDKDQSKTIYDALGATTERSGGSVANTIAALGALGRKAAFVGKRRDDQFGEIFAHDIRATGATFTADAATTGEETARCMVMVTPDAERTMATYLGVSGDLGPGDIDAATIADSAILYLEGYLWDKPAAKEAFRAAMDAAHAAERRVALSLSDPFCVERHRDSFRQIVAGDVDILFANEAELLSLVQTGDFEGALATVSNEVAVCAVTRSEKGAVIVSGGARYDVPADEIGELVDTTGAGDLFAAGFLNGLTTGQAPDVCGQMGCAAAGVVIQKLGARCGRELVERFKTNGWLS